MRWDFFFFGGERRGGCVEIGWNGIVIVSDSSMH